MKMPARVGGGFVLRPTAHLLFRAFAFYASMDKLTWFKFAPADWMMGRIRKMPKEVQADFLSLCCIYWNNLCTLSSEDAELECGADSFALLVKHRIIKQKEGTVAINFLDIQMAEIVEVKESKRKAANIRWNPDAMHVHSKRNANAMQNDADKIRVDKKRKEKEEKVNSSINSGNSFELMGLSFPPKNDNSGNALTLRSSKLEQRYMAVSREGKLKATFEQALCTMHKAIYEQDFEDQKHFENWFMVIAKDKPSITGKPKFVQ